MKAWLKGGLIGGGISLIVFLIMQECIPLFLCPEGATCGNAIFCVSQSILYSIITFIIISILLAIFFKSKRGKQ